MFCCGSSTRSSKISKKDSLFKEKGKRHSSQGSVVTSEKHVKSLAVVVKYAHERNLFEEFKILNNIFRYLTVNELLKARLVNKLWNKHACEVLREKLEGVVILQRGLDYYTRVMSSSLDIPIGRVFLNILDMGEPQPKIFFRSLGHSIYQLILNLEGHSVPQFQTSLFYLQNMKQLSINLFDQHENDDDDDLDIRTLGRRLSVQPNVQILIEDYDDENNNNNMPVKPQLPNLESFILSCEPSWNSNEPFLIEQIIQAAPQLKNLNLQKWPFPLKHDLFSKVPFENLTFLTVSYLGDEELKVLASKRLPLKSADFNLDYDVVGDALDMFLQSVASTLEYIRVESKSNQSLVFRVQTKMPELLTIRLTTWVGPIWLDTVAGNSENLMKIQLSNCDPGRISQKYPKSNLNVKYLAVNFGNFSTVSPSQRTELVSIFLYAFPNLESFMMRQVSDKILGQIVNGWPKLKSLRVTSAFGLTDSGLTGIPVAELSKMTKLEYKLSCGCCLPVPVVDYKPCVDNVRQYPHIGKLTNLLDLSIESEEGSHFPLTNFSLHLGVHELVKLESLKITCHNELGPHWCLRCIADNLPNLKELTVMDRAISHDRYGEHEVLYLLKKLPKMKLHLTPTKQVDHHSSQLI